MNCNKRIFKSARQVTTTSAFLLMTFLVLATSHVIAAPQDEEEAMILQYGPDPELFKLDSLEMVVQGWKWKASISHKQQKLIGQLKGDWQNGLEKVHLEMGQLQAELAAAGLAYPVDIRTVQKIDEEIRGLQSDIVGLTAQLKQIKGDAELAATEMKFERDSQVGEIELLKTKLKLVLQEYERISELYKAKSISRSEFSKLKASVAEMEITLQNAQSKLNMLEARLATDLSASVKAVAEEQRMLKDRLQELKVKKQMIEDLQPIQKIEALKAKARMAQQMVDMAQTKQFELELENTRNLALIELAIEKIERVQKKEKSDDEK